MNTKGKTKIFLLIMIPFFLAGLLLLLLNDRSYEKPIHSAYFSSQNFYEEAYSDVKEKNEKEVYGGILPHHLLVKWRIASFLEKLDEGRYENIILIGPNHFSNGDENIIISEADWQTPYGLLEGDTVLFNKFKKEYSVEENAMASEFAISGLVGFIKKSLPDVKILPIILKNSTTPGECEGLAKNIAKKINKNNTLVLATVDFSHYLPASVADFHDIRSRAIIENFDFERVYSMEIDSAPSVYTVLKYLDIIGANKSELIFSTNSGYLTLSEDEPTTTHNFYFFKKGELVKNNFFSFLFFGDLMLDRYVETLMATRGLDYFIDPLAGEEERFFKGVDIIGANLEGPSTYDDINYPPEKELDFNNKIEYVEKFKEYNFNFLNLANNHSFDQGERGFSETTGNLDKIGIDYAGCALNYIEDCSSKTVEVEENKIAFLGFNGAGVYVDEEKVVQEIKDARAKSDFVVVNIHWGVEYDHYFNKKQQNLAHKIIDAGADVIIGHHPHVVQGMEVYKNKPIFYSLGNFVFDQYFSKDVMQGLAVGINVLEKDMDIFLFPFKSRGEQLHLLKGEEKDEFFKNLAKWSGVENIEKEFKVLYEKN